MHPGESSGDGAGLIRLHRPDEMPFQITGSKGIHLGNWYRGPIDPPESNNAVFDYKKCITAEHLGEHTINLPTHINTALSDALKIVNFLKEIKYEKS